MSKFIELLATLSILTNGLTPLQTAAARWIKSDSGAGIRESKLSRFVTPRRLREQYPSWFAGLRKDSLIKKSFENAQSFNDCIPYVGQLKDDGYASTNVRRGVFTALYGPIPVGMELDHICHDPATCSGGVLCAHRACINPTHMQVATHDENHRRSKKGGVLVVRVGKTRRARKTTCNSGHAMTPENTTTLARGEHVCRACNAERQAGFRARSRIKRAAAAAVQNAPQKASKVA